MIIHAVQKPHAALPEKQTPYSVGYDLRALEEICIPVGEHRLIPTGLQIAVPYGYVGLICSRSCLALSRGLFVLTAPGIIDPDYRGDVSVILQNVGSGVAWIEAGTRIAQILVLPCEHISWLTVAALDETQRGTGGFGSTNA